MKRIFAVGCALLAGSLMADAASEEVVRGQNELGVLAVTTTTKNTIVPIAFTELSDGSSMKIADFVKTQNLEVGDQVAVYTGTKDTYDTWQLAEDQGTGAKYWQAVTTKMTLSGGGLTSEPGKDASSVAKVVGTGVWLILKDDRAATSSVTFYINGKPVDNPTTLTAAGAWNLLGNPKSTSFNSFVGDSGDQVVIPDGSGFKNYLYGQYAKGSSGWYYETWEQEKRTVLGKEEWVTTCVKHPETPTIDGGKGFWYYTQSARALTW